MAKYLGSYQGKILSVVRSPVIPVSKSMQFIRAPKWTFFYSDESIMNYYHVRGGDVVSNFHPSKPKHMKAALISLHGTQCGISTYSEWLWRELSMHFRESQVFAEFIPGQDPEKDEPGITRCWERGRSLRMLAREIKEWDPDVIYIQHEFGLFPDARHWLALLDELSRYRIIVTMHSVYEHEDKTVCEAPLKNIVVHTLRGKQCLISKGSNADITVIPHGSHKPAEELKLWNIYKSNHTLIQFGFGFKYKNWDTTLKAVDIIKMKYPDVFFTGLFSQSQHNFRETEINYLELQHLIDDLNIRDNVAFVKGYQSEKALKAFLRTNQIALFPYHSPKEHKVYAASGAVRIAMQNQLPCIVSRMPHFDDLEGVCPRVEGEFELAQAVEQLFNPVAVLEQIKRQNKFLKDTAWDQVAKMYRDLA